MAKKINITDKLNFESNPIVVIGDLEVEVKANDHTISNASIKEQSGSGDTGYSARCAYDRTESL